MSPHELIVAKKKIAVARLVLRERRPPPPELSVQLRPQHLRWEVGKYRDRIRSGPGGLGRAKIWTPERVGEQHNLVLDSAYELVATYGFGKLHKYMAVGTGSSAPAATQTALDAELVRSRTPPSGFVYQYSNPSPGTYVLENQVEFTEAEVGGQNLSEWGVAPDATSVLAVRELFRDSSNNAIVLSLAADQRLRLIYAYQINIQPNAPQTVSIAVTNLGTLTGTWVPRGASDDLQVINTIANGASGGTYASTLLYMGTFDFQVGQGYNDSDPTYFHERHNYNAAIGAYTAGSRRREFAPVWQTSEFNRTIASIGLSRGEYASWAGFWLVLDTGSVFTKDNLHKFIWDPWVLTW